MYDAIIVGARCAGAPTAMLLARKGYRVLLVDRASFPSDTISTHIIWPHGCALLDSWGLFDRLAATGCPPVARQMIFDLGAFALTGGVPGTNRGRGGLCPRRTVLDKLLVDAAVEAGAELREEFGVQALVWDADRVTGIKGASRGGRAVEERARVVIGADTNVDVRRYAMYVIREVLHCKPGQVRRMIEKFRCLSAAMTDMGHEPLRLLTDVTGGPFWTVIAEIHVAAIDDFFAMEQRLMASETLRKTMAGYHDLVESGRREIYRIEADAAD